MFQTQLKVRQILNAKLWSPPTILFMLPGSDYCRRRYNPDDVYVHRVGRTTCFSEGLLTTRVLLSKEDDPLDV